METTKCKELYAIYSNSQFTKNILKIKLSPSAFVQTSVWKKGTRETALEMVWKRNKTLLSL